MHTKRSKRNTKLTRKRRSSSRFPAWLSFGLLSFAVIIFAGGYLAQISATSSKGFAIRSLRSEIDDLKGEKEKMEFQVAKERSMVAVEEKVVSMGMVPASDIEYMNETTPMVAVR